jgi:hypothetical protein
MQIAEPLKLAPIVLVIREFCRLSKRTRANMAQKKFKMDRLLTFLLLSSALAVEAETNRVSLDNSFKGLPSKLAIVETSETKESNNRIDSCEWDSMTEHVRFATAAYYPERFH